MIDGSPYQGYLYAYPHKTSYRPLDPRPALADVWRDEPRDALFLYVHVPFCEMRCGFCNLFTRTGAPAEQVTAYLRQLRHQASRVALDGAVFARAAIGGGTPTYLEADELAALFDICTTVMGARLPGIPLSVETSPATATPDRLAVLTGYGTTRVSIGVQSFLDAEAHAAGRPQRRADVERALAAIRDARVPVLNLDLIYGIDGQTADTWRQSLDAALAWRPEEIFLYPLYVRPLTGLGRRAATRDDWDAQRLALYRQGRDTLLAAGYRQESMRQFRLPAAADDGPDYSCQDDGMIGLGCGARSYTRDLHYSFDYAVSVTEVRAVLDDYLSRPPADFAYAEVGFALSPAEQRRRWLIKSLLRADGVDISAYRRRFGADPVADFPQLAVLSDTGLTHPGTLRLTPAGLERSDAIGPWLTSAQVRTAMAGYHLR
ncbi:coproporphyrinogen III oxidase [Actinoplanes sp. SE50]|uniref:STM4012 family radical SAM protein n=1 Tax=unclassified Actinoplanes TaxID=2626549 RepID=UPI00023ED023|nr:MULTISPECIES: STM4012 family radical SAM protein [unclassified Actinoplanes]AEV83289.1 oxygen-independent coproporphyrinogen III oxidase [Actinoplanes sp. SE50/110]ATO81682.1 coproporphyrinogen III oxidase [Actinoplanes sp. SE50]SLL99090.1 coproporphyrinogen III oxidase [Actinoplanes sp. SE50/110]